MKPELSTAIINAIINCEPCISNEIYRYSLNGVHVKNKDDKELIVEATDAHKLVRYSFKDEDALKILPKNKDIIISKDSMRMIKAFKKGGILETLPCDFQLTGEGSRRKLTITQLDQTIALSLVDSEYPDSERVIPKNRKEDFKIRLDANYLEQVVKAFGKKKHERFIELSIDTANALSPIIVRPEDNEEIMAVIMPRRKK